jgi:hypothetical protein
MVIQSSADTGQLSVQLLTTITVLLLAATTLLLSKGKNIEIPAGDDPEE